ncbi:ABC transporter permease [Streptomyces sp. NPDC000880]
MGIRVSLTAVPNRGLFYAAGKLTVVGGPAFVVGLVTSLSCFLSGQAIIDKGFGIGIGDPGALRAVVGCALYFALISLLLAGLAALLRSVTGALSLLVPLFLTAFPDRGRIARQQRRRVPPGPGGAADPAAGSCGDAGTRERHGGPAVWSALATAAGWWALRRRGA